jgi:two-component system LytT family sensor kinase
MARATAADTSTNQDRYPPFGWLVKFLLVVFGVGALLSASQEYFSILAEGEKYSFIYPLIWEFTGYFTSFLVSFPAYFFMRRFPISRGRLWRIPLHVAASFGFSLLSTTLFYVVRLRIYGWFGLGHYDYGILFYRYLYEFHKFMIFYWSFYGLLRLYSYVVQNRERELRTVQLESQLNQARVEALKTQINPHFLFNTLNTISSEMYESVPAADRMISLLGDMLRRTLARSDRQLVTVSEELELLELYLGIMRARFEDKLVIDLRASDAAENALVPSFLLQPLVENAIKYNQPTGEQIARVWLTTSVEEGRLRLEVADNGPGLKPNFQPGTGLANVLKRLEYLYGRQARLDFRAREGGGLRVVLDLPFKQESESQDASAQVAEEHA